jgi:hypothetical protein
MCKGGSLQLVLQLNQITQTPQYQNYLQIITSLQQRDIQDINKSITRYTREIIKSHPRAKHAPSGFYPTWTAFTGNLPTQALKDETSDASPSGILKHLPIHTTTMIN